MDDRCLPVAELGDLCASSPDDPRWRHVAACPRCRALVASYRRFLAGTPGLDDPEAAAELARRLDAVLAADAVPAPPGRRRRAWMLPAGLAAAAVLAAVIVAGRWEGNGPPPVTVRGPAGEVALATGSPRPLADGAILLAWSARPGADGYRVRILDAALAPVADRPAGKDTTLVLAAAERAGGVYWEVVATTGGTVVARSAPRLLTGP